MNLDRTSPVIKHPTRLQTASEDVVSIAVNDLVRPPARPVLELNREMLVENGLWGFVPEDPRARPFVRLRAQILNRIAQGSCGKIIAVVSPCAGTGKSFVAANLAAALGEIHNVCLIDLDLRNPSIGDLVGAPACLGLETLLAGEHRLAEIGCVAADARLVVLPAKRAADATRLLASDTLPAMFEILRRDSNTICIVDTPAALDMDDAAIVARSVDAVLLVAEEGHTTTRNVRETLRLLHPTPLVGTVLNRAMTLSSSPAAAKGR